MCNFGPYYASTIQLGGLEEKAGAISLNNHKRLLPFFLSVGSLRIPQ